MKQKASSNISKIISLFTISVIVLGTYFFIATPSPAKKKFEDKPQENKIDIGGNFELTNLENNKENTIKYSGKYKLVYFGFTYCPDICPTALTLISKVIDTTDKYGIDIVPMFVTIDPKRDTIGVLGPYLKHFNPKIIGYTGSEEEIKSVANLFRVYYQKVERSDAGPNDYLVDHSSFIYLMSPDMKYIKHFPSTAKPETIANYIHTEVKSIK